MSNKSTKNTYDSNKFDKDMVTKRLNTFCESAFGGNKSKMSRELGKTPNSFYAYFDGNRTPGPEILLQLYNIGVNINWLLTGKGSMLLNDQSIGKAAEPSVHYHVKEKSIAKMLQIIIDRLEEVDFGEDIKMEILKETLNRISVEQNAHFLEKELNRE